MRPVIHSTKHYVQITRSSLATVSAVTEDIILAVESTVANLVDEVEEGAVVKAVYFELWLQNEGNDASTVVIVVKSPIGNVGPTFANMNSLGTFNNKKNILFTHQGLTPNDAIQGPMNVLRGWIKIPKSKQRFGLGDRLHLVISNSGASTLQYCGFATYKEYT